MPAAQHPDSSRVADTANTAGKLFSLPATLWIKSEQVARALLGPKGVTQRHRVRWMGSSCTAAKGPALCS